ncbi:MAG: PD40 domain-containing protein, partial [Planctomycetes bacterium]|nr:PD40 domain-containing protein [Planctomycetota bacterium]
MNDTSIKSVLLGALICVSVAQAGCAGGGVAGHDGGGGDGAEAGTDGLGGNGPGVGPQSSPRSDGATLLFTPYRPDNPKTSAQNTAFSPDGRRIVFTLFLNGYNVGPAELWIVSVDGSDARRLTPVEDQDNVNVPGAAWNAVTDEIVFASDRGEADDIWAIRPDGTGLRQITEHDIEGDEPPYWIEPVWSPDGDWIVFEADTEADTELEQRGTIFKVRSDGTDLTQLTKRDGADFDDRLPNWSPDGDRILFQRRLPNEGDGDNWDVYVVDTDGDEAVNVSNAPKRFNTDASWSADGRWIASSSSYGPDAEELPHPNITGFFVPDAESDESVPNPVRITFGDRHEDVAPGVSPDGRTVAFESHRTAYEPSPSDLWIIALPEALA